MKTLTNESQPLRPAQGEIIPSAQQQARRDGRPTPRHSFAAENLRIGSLHAARQRNVPSAGLLRRVQLKVCSLKTCELTNEGGCFFCNEAVPLKRKSAKIERVQPTPGVAVEHWVF